MIPKAAHARDEAPIVENSVHAGFENTEFPARYSNLLLACLVKHILVRVFKPLKIEGGEFLLRNRSHPACILCARGCACDEQGNHDKDCFFHADPSLPGKYR